jgi:acetyl esterase/lipase
MFDLRVIFGGMVCLALAGLTAFWAASAATPAVMVALDQAATASPTSTRPATAAAEPSATPGPLPTATATASAAPTKAPSATPGPQPAVIAATADAMGRAAATATLRSPPTVAQRPTVAPDETRPPAAGPLRPSVPAALPSVSLAADIPYVVRPGAPPQQTSLDVYHPAAAGLPVLIYIHGGGWSSGDKADVGAKAAYFTAHGFVFVSVNYRLIPSAWPAQQAADVAAAVAWVKGNIRDYGGDGARLFLLGHSAGAHLAALIAADESYLQELGLGPGALRGVILLDSAAYDVEQLMRSPEGQAEPFRSAFGDDPGQWRRVSPRAKVGPGKEIPSHLLLLSTSSGQRRPAAEGLADALRAAGVYAHIADACSFRNHVTINEELGRADDPAIEAVQGFLDMLLRAAAGGRGGVEVLRPRP